MTLDDLSRRYGLDDPVALSTIVQEILRELDALSKLPEHPRVVRFAGCAFSQFAGVHMRRLK